MWTGIAKVNQRPCFIFAKNSKISSSGPFIHLPSLPTSQVESSLLILLMIPMLTVQPELLTEFHFAKAFHFERLRRDKLDSSFYGVWQIPF